MSHDLQGLGRHLPARRGERHRREAGRLREQLAAQVKLAFGGLKRKPAHPVVPMDVIPGVQAHLVALGQQQAKQLGRLAGDDRPGQDQAIEHGDRAIGHGRAAI